MNSEIQAKKYFPKEQVFVELVLQVMKCKHSTERVQVLLKTLSFSAFLR